MRQPGNYWLDFRQYKQKNFHGKPLQSSWKGQVAWGISLGNHGGTGWMELTVVLMEQSFGGLIFPITIEKV